jgi:hypothetical protein
VQPHLPGAGIKLDGVNEGAADVHGDAHWPEWQRVRHY